MEEIVTVNERAIFKDPVHHDDCLRTVNTVASQQSYAWSRSHSAFPTSLSNSLSFQNQEALVPKVRLPDPITFHTILVFQGDASLVVCRILISLITAIYTFSIVQVDDSPITQDP